MLRRIDFDYLSLVELLADRPLDSWPVTLAHTKRIKPALGLALILRVVRIEKVCIPLSRINRTPAEPLVVRTAGIIRTERVVLAAARTTPAARPPRTNAACAKCRYKRRYHVPAERVEGQPRPRGSSGWFYAALVVVARAVDEAAHRVGLEVVAGIGDHQVGELLPVSVGI